MIARKRDAELAARGLPEVAFVDNSADKSVDAARVVEIRRGVTGYSGVRPDVSRRTHEPIGLAFMTRADIRVHPDGELLRRLGDDLPLDFCPTYGARPEAAAADARTWAASPYRLALMQRALARSNSELHGFRWRYEETARRIAGAIIGASC